MKPALLSTSCGCDCVRSCDSLGYRHGSFRSIVLGLAGGAAALSFLTAGGLAVWALSGGADGDSGAAK